MAARYEVHMTVGEYIARLLDAEASQMPPADHREAEQLRDLARMHRQIKDAKSVRISAAA
ncbi:hypothetical protein AB4Y89_12295 [Terriglobus sp. 2YAB30_2]|uniref:hypothetical protein n=1 Tax=unclassified Terriglobus TaxID=2628988 RepID=UPI003F98294E